MPSTCRNHDCTESTILTRVAPTVWRGTAVDNTLEFCSVDCLVAFCSEPSNFPVIDVVGEDECFIYQPDLEIDDAVAAATAGGDRDV
jgi:hypothetical protein